MKFKTHLLFAFLLFLVFWPFFEGLDVEKWIFAIVFLVAAVFPDIDSRYSKIGRHFPFGWFLKHRNFFHSFLFCAIVSLTIEFFFGGYGFAAFFGFVTHLLLDSFNHQGISLFYPFSKYRVKGPFKTDGFGEKILFFSFLIGLIFMLFLG